MKSDIQLAPSGSITALEFQGGCSSLSKSFDRQVLPIRFVGRFAALQSSKLGV